MTEAQLKTNAEVANKVRTEMTKEKLLKRFKDFIGEKEFRIFSNTNKTLTINQSSRRTKL
jgi:tRNA U38,U39,U40 pseudouridine synthase TruA